MAKSEQEHPNKAKKLDEDPRPLFRIGKCCGSCYYFRSKKFDEVFCGICIYPMKRKEYDQKYVRKNWLKELKHDFLPASSACVCFLWKRNENVKGTHGEKVALPLKEQAITKWCGAKYIRFDD